MQRLFVLSNVSAMTVLSSRLIRKARKLDVNIGIDTLEDMHILSTSGANETLKRLLMFLLGASKPFMRCVNYSADRLNPSDSETRLSVRRSCGMSLNRDDRKIKKAPTDRASFSATSIFFTSRPPDTQCFASWCSTLARRRGKLSD